MKFIVAESEKSYFVRNQSDIPKMIFDRYSKEELVFQEHFWVIPLNAKLECFEPIELFRGGASACLVDTVTLLRAVLLTPSASSFIIVHNHPAGTKEPSKEDLELKMKIKGAASAVGLSLLDSVIVTPDGDTISY